MGDDRVSSPSVSPLPPIISDPLPEVLVWMGIELRVPPAWDILRHSVDPLKGSVSLADRRRQRLQVTWTQCRKRPDMGRMLREYEKREGKRDDEAVFDAVKAVGGWRGVHRRFTDTGVLTRVMRYDERYERLIELALTWHEDAGEDDLAAAVMAGCRFAEPATGARRWRAFGLDFTLPELEHVEGRRRSGEPPMLLPLTVKVEPGDTLFRFAGEVHRRGGKQGGREAGGGTVEVWLRRLGMAEVWYDGDPTALLRSREPKLNFGFDEFSEGGGGGRNGVEAVSLEPGPRVKRWAGRLRRRRDRVWLDEATDAVLWVTTLSPPRGTQVKPREVAVASWW